MVLSEIVIYGFLGGALRAAAGFMEYGTRDAFIRIFYLGVVGVACAFAFTALSPVKALYLVAPAYAGTDFLKSMFEIADKSSLRV